MRSAHRRLAVWLLSVLAVLAVLAVPALAREKRHVRPCVVPRLVGLTLPVARRRLEHAGCRVGAIHRAKGGSGPLVVYREGVRAGRKVRRGTKVTLWVRAKKAAAMTTPTVTSPTVTAPAAPAAPALITTYLYAGSQAEDGATDSGTPTAYFDVSATLGYLTASNATMYLVGQPVTFTAVNDVTGATVLTFQASTVTGQGTSVGCAIAYSVSSDQSTLTLTGEPINPQTGAPDLPACFSGTLTVPYSDPIDLDASFAGNSTYAASTDMLPGGL